MDTLPFPETVLELGVLLTAARDKAGLHDFGDESFVPALQALLQSLDKEANLSPIGRIGQFTRIVDLLVNRLRVEHWLQQHPEILKEHIAPPVVIVGLMRTGTTLLQRLMACDRRFYTPLWYETRYPAPLADYDFKSEDARIALAQEEVRQMLEASPDLASIHPLEACAADEDVMLLEHSFYSTVPESFAHLPGYARWLEQHDNTPGYQYLRRLLQCLQWQKKRAGQSADRWLLKTPHHLHHLKILLAVFPGATVIQTHRDPLQTVPSLCSMNYALACMGSDSVDAYAIGRHWCDKFARSLRQSLQVRAQHPRQFIDVQYTETASDAMGVVSRIYARLGMDLDKDTQATMRQWLEANRREDRNPHHYTLEQFGFTRAGLEQQFADYRETFLT
jgi:Sulfotransferase family